jgi:hypothetical protein
VQKTVEMVMIPFFAVARNKWTETAEEVFWQMRNVEALKEKQTLFQKKNQKKKKKKKAEKAFALENLPQLKDQQQSTKVCAQ